MEPERRVEAEGEQGQGGRDPDIQKESQFHGRTAPEIKREPDRPRNKRRQPQRESGREAQRETDPRGGGRGQGGELRASQKYK